MKTNLYLLGLIIVILALSCSNPDKKSNVASSNLNEQESALLSMEDMISFDSLFFAWEQNWKTNPITKLSSNTYDARKLEEYPQLIAMGEKIIPLIITKLTEDDNFFALVLYDELQEMDSLKSTNMVSEQERAKETVTKYVEAKLGHKRRKFDSDQEKIQAMKELFESNGWIPDENISQHDIDSVLLKYDYEIIRDFIENLSY